MRSLLTRFLRNEAGATAIEYAIIAGGLSIVIVVVVGGIGANLSGRFAAIGTSLK
jgi:pilus assembly protein Flp/PilA